MSDTICNGELKEKIAMDDPRTVACPESTCGALVGEDCYSVTGARLRSCHASRLAVVEVSDDE